MTTNSDQIILSYGDACVRRSDVELLYVPNWFNDTLIELAFEEFFKEVLHSDDRVQLVSPSVTQFIKSMCNHSSMEELTGIIKSKAKLILLAINDHSPDCTRGGGFHWALLVVDVEAQNFRYYDSLSSTDSSKNSISPILEDAYKIAGLIKSYFKWPSLNFDIADCPRQDNSYDCGAHVVANARKVTADFLGLPNGRINCDNIRDYLMDFINRNSRLSGDNRQL